MPRIDSVALILVLLFSLAGAARSQAGGAGPTPADMARVAGLPGGAHAGPSGTGGASIAAPLPPLRGPAAMPSEEVEAELQQARELYRGLVAYHPLLQNAFATAPVVDAALRDAQRYTAELDERFALAPLFFADEKALAELRDITAKAHLQAALLAARGVDLELSAKEYDRAAELLGHDPADWDAKIERHGTFGSLPGAAEMSFHIAPVRAAVEDLKRFWAAGAPVRFEIHGYSSAERATLRLTRLSGGTDPFIDAVYRIGDERFRAQAAAGRGAFQIALPPGSYRAASVDPGTGRELLFVVEKGGVPDPIVLSPHTFHFALAQDDRRCKPELTLNGATVRSLRDLSYGTYRVRPGGSCRRRLPDKIVVEERPESTVRLEPDLLEQAREGQPVFLYVTTPPGATVTLRL